MAAPALSFPALLLSWEREGQWLDWALHHGSPVCARGAGAQGMTLTVPACPGERLNSSSSAGDVELHDEPELALVQALTCSS